MNWVNYDAVVVGNGLAGSLMAYALSKAGLRACRIQTPGMHTASLVGAGIMNPITGRRYRMSWNYPALVEHAVATYKELEYLSGQSLLTEMAVVKALPAPGDENEWLLRCEDPEYSPYMSPLTEETENLPWAPVHGAGIIRPVWRVDMPGVLDAIGSHCGVVHDGVLLPKRVLELAHGAETIPQSIPLIIATGAGLPGYGDSTWPLNPYKGEALILESPDLPGELILHHRLHSIPLGDGSFWVGSYNRWDFEHPEPTRAGLEWLTTTLEKTFPVKYRILRHVAGVRPSTDRRRPIVGPVPGIANTWVCNGLGTKGVSLAPYLSTQLTNHLCTGAPLDPEILWPWH